MTTPSLEQVDVREVAGTFKVTTLSGTRYFIEADKDETGQVRVTSDGKVPGLFTGVVGCGEAELSPVIEIGRPLFVANGVLVVRSTPVCYIKQVEDLIDTMVCPSCSIGFKEPGQPCKLCCHNDA